MPSADAPLTLADLADIPVSRLRGVGERKEQALADVEITTVLDLLEHYPRRYIDRTREAAIDELEPGDEAMVLGTVVNVDTRRTKARKTMVTATLSDGSGRLKLTFFNQPWRARQLGEGTQAVVFGKVDR